MPFLILKNGRPVSPEHAVVSVFDRGFLYGDSIYEVIRTYDGVPFEVEAHLERLAASAAYIGMSLPVSMAVLRAEILEGQGLASEGLEWAPGELYFRLILTRGAGPIGLDPALAVDPVRFLIIQPLPAPTAAQYAEGVAVATTAVRRNLRTALSPQAKTGNYLNSVLALREARGRGAYEGVMLDYQGRVTEGSTSNVFIVRDGRLETSPVDIGLLSGITRSVLLQVAGTAGITAVETPLSQAELAEADEVLLTSTVRELLPVVQVDGHPVGDGRPGPVYHRLRRAFAYYVAEHNRRHRAELFAPMPRPSEPSPEV